jgi:hypothetical protein
MEKSFNQGKGTFQKQENNRSSLLNKSPFPSKFDHFDQISVDRRSASNDWRVSNECE